MTSPCFSPPQRPPSDPREADDRTGAAPDSSGPLVARRIPFGEIPREAWDRLFARTHGATPFSRWTVHRAWWDAYGATAHEQYLACLPGDRRYTRSGKLEAPPPPEDIRGIVPLMHRHEVEPEDETTATALRRRYREVGRAVPPSAKAIFFGASYHADYATVLADPNELRAVAWSVAEALAGPPDSIYGSVEWDVVDLRRLRDEDPALPALEEAFRGCTEAHGWEVCLEQEYVCPLLEVPDGGWEAYLAALDKRGRHEVRRKWRRLEAAGEPRFVLDPPERANVEAFIELHQARWGDEGLFRQTEGGARSRRFLHRLAELEAADPGGPQLHFGRLEVSGKTIFAAAGFDDGRTTYFYNMGIAPDARELSPGVNGTAAYLKNRIEAGRRHFDFMRGDEPYKYEWGARDRPLHRLLLIRTTEPGIPSGATARPRDR
ncbi:MAG: GNAT family N-acetyltransferase [Chloroflexota bacterium]|nr:GNAT family N-acetyltransferase [Chloroflexota bacterium]